MTAINAERARSRNNYALSDAEVRLLYLTPEMRALRDQLVVTLRGLLTAEQLPTFEANLVALKVRDGPGDG